MICECIKDLEEKLSNNKFKDAKMKNVSFSFSENMESFLMIPFSYQEMKKDGTPKKSLSEIPVRANFCPFCGKKLKK